MHWHLQFVVGSMWVSKKGMEHPSSTNAVAIFRCMYIYIGIHVFLYFVPFPRIKTWKNTCQSLIYRSLKSPFILWEHTRPPETWVPRCQSLGLSTQLPRLTANLGPGDLVSSWSHRDFHGIPSARWCFWVSHQLNPNVFDDVWCIFMYFCRFCSAGPAWVDLCGRSSKWDHQDQRTVASWFSRSLINRMPMSCKGIDPFEAWNSLGHLWPITV